MQRPESCGASAALELWPLAGREGADSGESCRLLLEEASRLPQLRGKAPHLVKQNASLQIYRKHVAALRGGKLALLSSDALRKDILSLIPKGK